MTMTPPLRKFALTVHITSSVSWIGAVMAYLGLVIAALTSQDAQVVRALWTAMKVTAWYVLTPMALASLLTGLIMSLGTRWGLFRHYWVLISLVLTIIATIVLLTQLETIRVMADTAAGTDAADSRRGLWSQLLHAGGGLLVLLVIQVLNIYKPRGMTPYGWRKQQEQRLSRQTADATI